MACFKPLKAWRDPFNPSGKLLFSPHTIGGSIEHAERTCLKIPCGRCVGCRIDYSRGWAVRCSHEASLHLFNCFITLTYSPEFLPLDGSLDLKHFQKFMKRFREKVAPLKIRFFHCGEYGDLTRRPHYHALIFGYDFPDKVLLKQSKSGDLYTSEMLTKLWGKGHCSVGALTFESAAYVSRYVMKKVTGDPAKAHYEAIDYETGEIFNLKPEYVTMSRMPAIAREWFNRFKDDVYANKKDFITVNGRKMRPPKYYDRLLKNLDPDLMEDIIEQRLDSFDPSNSTPERLDVRRQVSEARLAQYSRDVV